jgi:hypothetical protein
VLESKNKIIKSRLGTGLSEAKFVQLAIEHSDQQFKILCSEKNRSLSDLLNTSVQIIPPISSRIECYFPDVKLWFRGTVATSNVIEYDGDDREVDDWTVKWRFGSNKKRITGLKK